MGLLNRGNELQQYHLFLDFVRILFFGYKQDMARHGIAPYHSSGSTIAIKHSRALR